MDVDPASFDLPAESSFDNGPTSYASFDATNSMSCGAPRSRACSTASSVQSFASSAFSTWTPQDSPNTSAHGRVSLAGTLATKLVPSCTGEGFVVDAGMAGRVDVGWQELVDLLLDPATTSTLHPEHIVAQTAAYLRARLASAPGLKSAARSSAAIQSLDNGLDNFSFDAPDPSPPHPYVQPALVSGLTAEPTSYDFAQAQGLFGHVQPASGTRSSVSTTTYDSPALALPTPPAHFCAPSDFHTPPPLQRTFSTSSSRPSSLRSLSPPRAPSFRSAGERESFSARRRSHNLRQTSSPYPYPRPPPQHLQTAHLSASSLHEFAGPGYARPRVSGRDSEAYSEGGSSLNDYDEADDDYRDLNEDEEPGTAIPPELRKTWKRKTRRALRPLNRETETRANARLAGLPKLPLDPDDSADQRSLRSIDSRVSSFSASSRVSHGQAVYASGTVVQQEAWLDPYASTSGSARSTATELAPVQQHPQPHTLTADSMSTSFLSFDD
ncbi:hypothetical protein JCM10295v2_004852 [Rhodotorula toruloides]